MKAADIKVGEDYAYSPGMNPRYFSRVTVIAVEKTLVKVGPSWERTTRSVTKYRVCIHVREGHEYEDLVYGRWLHWTWAEQIERDSAAAEAQVFRDGLASTRDNAKDRLIAAFRASDLTVTGSFGMPLITPQFDTHILVQLSTEDADRLVSLLGPTAPESKP